MYAGGRRARCLSWPQRRHDMVKYSAQYDTNFFQVFLCRSYLAREHPTRKRAAKVAVGEVMVMAELFKTL
jgi:hypothetical protein